MSVHLRNFYFFCKLNNYHQNCARVKKLQVDIYLKNYILYSAKKHVTIFLNKANLQISNSWIACISFVQFRFFIDLIYSFYFLQHPIVLSICGTSRLQESPLTLIVLALKVVFIFVLYMYFSSSLFFFLIKLVHIFMYISSTEKGLCKNQQEIPIQLVANLCTIGL